MEKQQLHRHLKDEYVVIFLDFQMLSHHDFADDKTFTWSFSRELLLAVSNVKGLKESALDKLGVFTDKNNTNGELLELF